MSLQVASYNFATKNKFIFTIPYQSIDSRYTTDNVILNITRCTLPAKVLIPTDLPARGRTISYPTVREGPKTIDIGYMIDSSWKTFSCLYRWYNMISSEPELARTYGTEPPIKVQERTYPQKFLLSTTLQILTEFKEPIVTFKFHGSWISGFGALDFDYQAPDDAPLQHSITLTYAYMTTENILDSSINTTS